MPDESRTRILVVDDSAVFRGFWTRILGNEPDLEIVSAAINGARALEAIDRHPVDVMILDLEMPEMDGITAIPLILKKHPEIRIIVASSLTTEGSEKAVQALSLGATDYVAKPSSLGGAGDASEVATQLLEKVRALRRRKPAAPATPVAPTAPTAPAIAPLARADQPARVVVIGCSTGGPHALGVVMPAFRREFTLPILIVQHMPPMFTAMLADRLEKETGRPCREAANGEGIRPGVVYVAPGDHHMTLEGSAESPTISLNQAPPENFCRPAVDPLFRSAARIFGNRVVAAVLTGMGEDGRKGCEALSSAGAWIIAQDEPTSVVWGMPGAVVRAGFAREVVPLNGVAQAIESAAGGTGARR